MSAVDTSESLTTTKSTSLIRGLAVEVPSLEFTGDDSEEPIDLEAPIARPLATQPSAKPTTEV